VSASVLSDGNLSASAASAFQQAGTSLISAAAGFSVWSRPKKDAGGAVVRPGSRHEATAAAVWTELAVLRRRRL
jgi:hypothetical protein